MERYLADLEHEQLLVRRGERSGLYCLVAVHSTARGPALGGCRLWRYDDARAAVRDALRLARGMTHKSAVADLPLGGGKGVIMLREGDELPPRAASRRPGGLRGHRRGARRRVRHRGGRRDGQPRHGGHRPPHPPRDRARAAPRRVRRPQSVHRPRRRGGRARRVRARVRLHLPARQQRSRSSASGTSGCASPACWPGAAPRCWSTTSTSPSARQRGRSERAGSPPPRRCARPWTSCARARSAACSTTTRSPRCRRPWWPARRTTSSRPTTSPRCSCATACSGSRTSSPTPVAS